MTRARRCSLAVDDDVWVIVYRGRTVPTRECIHVKNHEMAARLGEIADFLEIREVDMRRVTS